MVMERCANLGDSGMKYLLLMLFFSYVTHASQSKVIQLNPEQAVTNCSSAFAKWGIKEIRSGDANSIVLYRQRNSSTIPLWEFLVCSDLIVITTVVTFWPPSCSHPNCTFVASHRVTPCAFAPYT